LLPECQRRGVAVVLAAPYNSGILATGAAPANGSVPYFNYAPAPPQIMRKVLDIERVCREFAVPLKAAALQFPRAHRAVASVLAGVRSVAELDENLRMAGATIPREFWNALRQKGLIVPEAPLPGET
jgi:D-threo-aldose 1-dehydrogenase